MRVRQKNTSAAKQEDQSIPTWMEDYILPRRAEDEKKKVTYTRFQTCSSKPGQLSLQGIPLSTS